MTTPSGGLPAPVPCKDCGVLIERKYGGRGQKPQRCDDCRRKHLLAYDRERHRRISAEHREPCPRCGQAVEERSKRRTPYCTACYPIVKRERLNAKERAARQRKGRQCRDCGAQLAFGGKQTPQRCEECRKRRRRSLRIAVQFRVSHERFDEILSAQGNACAICKTTDPGRGWSIDHDHRCCEGNSSCGRCIRGLLCTRCNSMLGLARDNPEILTWAIVYLRDPPALK